MHVFSKREAVFWAVGFLAALTLTIWLALKAVDYFFLEDDDDPIVETVPTARPHSQQISASVYLFRSP
jgi:hypothetical protein